MFVFLYIPIFLLCFLYCFSFFFQKKNWNNTKKKHPKFVKNHKKRKKKQKNLCLQGNFCLFASAISSLMALGLFFLNEPPNIGLALGDTTVCLVGAIGIWNSHSLRICINHVDIAAWIINAGIKNSNGMILFPGMQSLPKLPFSTVICGFEL